MGEKKSSEYGKWLEVAINNGISQHTFRNRAYKSRWTFEEAATLKPGERKANFKEIDDYELMDKNFDLFLQKGIEEHQWEQEQERMSPKKEWTLPELVYLVKYFHVDGPGGMAFHFYRRVKEVKDKVNELKANGDWDLYSSLSDEEYEKIVTAKESWKHAKELISC